MKVSLITTSFNSEKTIEDCIASIAAQNYNDIEHIIIDGDSSDKTMEIVKKNRSTISKIISEPDHGPYDAFNKGINTSTGDLIGFLHSSDYFFSNNIISKIVETLKKTTTDSIYGDLVYVNNDKEIVRSWTAGGYKKNNFLYGWMPPHPTFFVKRKIYEKFGLFELNFGSAADFELMLRFLYFNSVTTSYLPEKITCMRVGGLSDGGIASRLKAHVYDWKAWRVNGGYKFPFWTILKPLRKIKQFSANN